MYNHVYKLYIYEHAHSELSAIYSKQHAHNCNIDVDQLRNKVPIYIAMTFDGVYSRHVLSMRILNTVDDSQISLNGHNYYQSKVHVALQGYPYTVQ